MTWLIAPGIVLGIVALLCVFLAVAGEAVALLGLALVCGLASGVLVDKGWHAVNVRANHKHQAIYHDLRSQGYTLRSDQVYVLGKYLHYTTEVDLGTGRCILPLIARKDKGVWRPAEYAATGNSVVFLSPAQVAAFC